jgi:hypothetical protein
MRLTLPSALAAAAISSTVVPHEGAADMLVDSDGEAEAASEDVAVEELELEQAARSAEASTTGTT